MEEVMDSDEALLCHICQCPSDDLRLLSCSHSYCLECLEDWAKQKQNKSGLTCPECRQVTQLPTAGVSGLSMGISIRVAKELLSRSQSQREATCQFCRNEEVHSYCRQCRKNLCHSCSTQHTARTVFADHQLKRAGPKCLKHSGEPLEFYCMPCQMGLCVICTHEHEHEPTPISKARERVASQLGKTMTKIAPKIEKLREIRHMLTSNMNGYEAMVNADHINVKDTVQRMSDDAVAKIFEWEQSMYTAIENSLTTKLTSYNKAVSDLKDIPETLDEQMDDQILLKGNRYAELVENIDKLHSNYSDFIPKTIAFEQNKEVLEQTIGCVLEADVDEAKLATFLADQNKPVIQSRQARKTTSGAKGEPVLLQDIPHAHNIAAIAFSSDQSLYVTDPLNQKLLHIDHKGVQKEVPILTYHPYGLAVAHDSTLYTCDKNEKKLLLYHPSWDEVLFRERPELKQPIGVGLLKDGRVVVSDASTCKVYIYGKDGKLHKSFGGPGSKCTQFLKPGYLTVDCNNHILIADEKAKVIKVWSHDGMYIKSINIGYDQLFYQYQSFTTDSLANIYVANRWENTIEKLSHDGQRIKKLEWSFLTGPSALAMGSNGQLAISQINDTQNAIKIIKIY